MMRSFQILLFLAAFVFISSSTAKANLKTEDPVYKKSLQSLQKTVPLTYNAEVKNCIYAYTKYQKNRFSRMLGLSKYYFPIYEKVFRDRNVPDEIKYLSVVESSLNPNAVSGYGAAGPWQFLYEMGKIYGLTVNDSLDERRDPYLACNAAASYLLDSYSMYGDWLLAIASYNCGRNNIRWAMEKAGERKDYWSIRQYLPVETQNYVPAYIATVYMMNNYWKHGISASESSLTTETETLIITKRTNMVDVANRAHLSLHELTALNPSYTKLLINGTLKNPKKLIVPVLPTYSYNVLCSVLGIPSTRPVIAAVTPKPANHFIIYRVQQGDSIELIASKFKNTSMDEILLVNKLATTDIIPGKILKIRQ